MSKAGNLPTLAAAFLYFDVSFMIWVMLGPLGPFLGEALHLSATQKGLLVAVPLLGGSFFRPILGVLFERMGGRRAGLLGLTISFLPLLLGWKFASTQAQLTLVGILLGIAGASFAVALPLASRWYPPKHQGVAMGIAGAGNSGTVFATLFAPRLAQAFGWHAVFAIAMLPLAAVWIFFACVAKDAPKPVTATRWSDYAAALRETDCAWFCFLYSLTFGGFVGLSSFLPTFFHDQYNLSKVASGDFVTVAVIAGSFLRPVGGTLADRIGGYRLLLALLTGVGLCMLMVAALPSARVALLLLAVIMGFLGMGNGSVFQMLPQRFPSSIGILTGVVGAAGGLGGFLLPSLLGYCKDAFGSFAAGLAICAVLAMSGAAALLLLGSRWRVAWAQEAADRAGVFCYRRLLKAEEAA